MEKQELERRKELLLNLFRDPLYKPMKIKELAILLDIHRDKRYELEESLNSLLEEGKISLNARGKFSLAEDKVYQGIYQANAKGFGFVRSEELTGDVFISEEKNFGALDGDRVVFVIERIRNGEGRSSEGRILNILEHANEKIVGIFQKNKHFGFVRPDNPKITRDIFVSEDFDMQAKSGDKVVAQIYDFGGAHKKPEAKIIEVLGNAKEQGVDILSIVKAYQLETDFSEALLQDAERLNTPPSVGEQSRRKDYRHLLTITIDGEDAKDLDDAISLSYDGKFWELGVHIADVTHYVAENSALDKEALKRGTSVYLVDRVLPMLPPALSNGICSLHAGEERLCLSCMMQIDAKGNVLAHRIEESIIQVDYRMTYTKVQAILDGDAALLKEYASLVGLLEKMAELSLLLRQKRYLRGAIDFDFPESKVILDEKGKVLEIKAYERNTATKLIEDFMLLANETVAQEYFWAELPFVYRIHENPEPEKMHSLSVFIHNFGYTLRNKSGQLHPKDLQKLLNSLEGSKEQSLINRIILRSMKKARYQMECSGHFGLAAKQYTHFTSPIRRYPDLQIHRIIKENIRSGLSEKRIRHYEKLLPEVCFHSSYTERRAEEAERESVKYKKCEYMAAHLGSVFTGIISGVNHFGFYVELENTVEGLVHVTDLKGDYYEYIEQDYRLVGRNSGISYRIGESVRVQVEAVDKLSKTIDFGIVEKI